MATIERRRGGYRVRWRDPDGRSRSRQCSTLATARELVRDVDRATELGQRWTPEASGAVPHLSDALERYLTERSRAVQPSSLRTEAVFLGVFDAWADEHGFRYVADLRKRLLGDFYDHLRASGQRGSRSVVTSRAMVRAVWRFWSWAAGDEDLAEYVRPPAMPQLPGKPLFPTYAPTWAEMDRCLEQADGTWQWRALVVLRCTGLRVQQVMRLEWRDVDLDRRLLTIRPDLGKTLQERGGRVVPLAPVLVGLMAGWGTRDGWLVPSGLTGKQARVYRSRDTRRFWERAGVRSEVWDKRPDHAFRKGFVTGLHVLGADVDAVEHLVGHARGLRGVYVDPDGLSLRRAVELVPPLGVPGVSRLPLRREQS